MNTILLVEDAPEYQVMVGRLLSHHNVIVTDDPDKVAGMLAGASVDLIILDITLPKRDGYSVLQELQVSPTTQDIPVFCLTGKHEITDKVTAFSLGADDFIQKPFDPMEFRARVESRLAKLQRKKQDGQRITLGDIVIDACSHRVLTQESNHDILLTQTEYKILTYLARRPGQVYSREQLLASVWGDEGAVYDRAVDVHVCSLRKKLAGHGISFKSVPGIGYKIELASGSSKKVS